MKAGKSSDTVTVLSSFADEGLGRLEGGVVGGDAAHQLDQLHHRHRVHEVHADEALRPVGRRGQAGDRDRRGVGGEDRLRIELRAELRIDLALDALVLGRRLDDEVGAGEIAHLVRGGNLAERRLAGLLGELAVSDHAGQVAADGGEPLLDAVRRDIVEQHLVAGQRGDLGDAAAHLPGADDAHSLDMPLH